MNGRKAEVRCENARRNRLAVRGYSLGGLPNPVKNKMVRFFAGNPQAIKSASVAEVGLRDCVILWCGSLRGMVAVLALPPAKSVSRGLL